jgi:WD40 repeat protein/tRNA A-37 threonylcarbamoyl transferase component Bud32
MKLRVTCSNPTCRKSALVPEEYLGKSVRCRGCASSVLVGGDTTTTDDGSPLGYTVVDEPAPVKSAPPSGPVPAKPIRPTDSTAAGVAPRPTGEKLGRFEVRAELGAGAFGRVYRAYDPQLDREVALKVPHAAALDSPKRVERFLREAKAAANLRHPHIVPVFDAGTDNGRHYIASAFIAGQKLADAVEASDGGLDFQRAARLARELAEALAYAHEQGIVHRDVKPDNVMLDQADRMHLMDFGLAARQDAESRLTSDGAVMGTPSYMAPEQAKGDTANVGPAADQYACGVVLYELLTGKTPFAGPVPVVLHNQIHTDPDPPGKLRASLPKDLETVCLKAMSKRPEDRYADCQALADDLRRYLEGEPVSARRLGAVEKAIRWVRRNPAAAGLVAAGVLVAGLLAVTAALAVLGMQAMEARDVAEKATGEAVTANDQLAKEKSQVEAARDQLADEQKRTSEARDEAVKQKEKADEQRKLAEKAEADAKKAQAAEAEARKQVEREREKLAVYDYGSTLRVAQEEWRRSDFGATRVLLDRTDPKLRGWEWRYLKRLNDSSQIDLLGHSAAVAFAAFTPDGRRVLTADQNGHVRTWDATTGKVHLDKFTGVVNSSVPVSLDGHRFLSVNYEKGPTLQVWDATTGKEVALQGVKHTTIYAAFSTDGRRVAATMQDRTAKVWDADTGKELLLRQNFTSWTKSLAFSPDGSRLFLACENAGQVWDTETGKEVAALEGFTGVVSRATFSPNGKRVVTTVGDNTARVWDVDTGRQVTALQGHTGIIDFAVFSPDGRRVLTACGNAVRVGLGAVKRDDTARVWDVASGKAVVFSGHKSSIKSAAFSPDGKRVVTASADGTARVWDADTGAEVLTLRGHTGSVIAAAFSPDGNRVVTGSEDRTAKVWDASTRKEGGVLLADAGVVRAVSRDGMRAVGITADQKAKVWDASTGKEITTLKGYSGEAVVVEFSPDGRRVVTATDKWARVWEADTGQPLAALQLSVGVIGTAVFSPDGKRLITTSNTRYGGEYARTHDSGIPVWDVDTGKQVLTLKGHTATRGVGSAELNPAAFSPDGQKHLRVSSAAFSPDGRWIVTASDDALRADYLRGKPAGASWDDTARVWDAATGEEVLVLKGHERSVVAATFSPDGKRVLTNNGVQVRVWDAAMGAVSVVINPGRNLGVVSAAFSPDGKQVVTVNTDDTARVWDAATGTGTEVAVLKGHAAGVVSAAFSPDGKRVVTTGRDLTVRVWDAATGAEVLTFRGYTGGAASWSLDGARIISGGGMVWDAGPVNAVAPTTGAKK